MSTTLYWHDYETFGQNPRWAGIAQFAGVRTDLSLQEVGPPLMVYCQPSRDSWPEPAACLITGITPQHCRDHGVPEPEFARRILRELSRPGTCGVGFNSIRFDDEFTRQLLYRNFHDPYEREWRNGNSRWDILDVLRMARALRPEGIVWPFDEQGVPVMRLEQLSAANGVAHDAAHDALSDVRATIAMARLLRQAQPKLFEYAFALRDKKAVLAMLDLGTCKPVLHTSSRYGSHCLSTALVMPLLEHPGNKNQVLVYDLMQDPADLLTLPAEALRERLFSTRQALEASQLERLAIKAVHANRSPMLASLALLDDTVAQRTGIVRSRCEQHWQQIQSHLPAIREKLRALYADRQEAGVQDAEFRLYDGFLDDADRATCREVRQADEATLAAHPFVFRDPRLQELLFRYRARHFPGSLSPAEQAQWAEWRQDRLAHPVSPDWITRETYLARIAALQAERCSPADQQVLAALASWVTEIDA